MSPGPEPVPTNAAHADHIDNIVQAESIDAVHVDGSRQVHHHDRRGSLVLGVIVVLLIGVGVYVWTTTRPAGPQGPASGLAAVAAVVDVAPKSDCKSGWVAPDPGNAPIRYGAPPTGSVLTAGGEVTVTVQGLTDDSVVLQGIDVEVLARRPAMSGVYLPSGCGSDLTPRYFQVDLAASRPTLEAEGGVVGFPYKVSGSDPEQFVITPLLGDGAVDWRLRISWSSGDRKGELVIDDHGQPLRTTAITRARPFCIEQPDGLRWVPRAGAAC